MVATDIGASQLVVEPGSRLLLRSMLEPDRHSSVFILTDSNVFSHWGNEVQKAWGVPESHFYIIDPGESSKTLAVVEQIMVWLLNRGADRHSLLVNFGGGVVTDVGAFVAGTFLRGIDFVNIPTSLMGQVDASIGGKCGVNIGAAKNSIGLITFPIFTLVDPMTLATLDPREFRSGVAEMLKHGLIWDAAHFEEIASSDLGRLEEKSVHSLLSRSIEIKLEIVRSDPKERDQRRLLNFGHTVGHALEGLLLKMGEPIRHGEAVAIGMVFESEVSQQLGFLSEKQCETIKNAIKSAGLPIWHGALTDPELVKVLGYDKKRRGQTLSWTLLKDIGKGITGIEIADELFAQLVSRGVAS